MSVIAMGQLAVKRQGLAAPGAAPTAGSAQDISDTAGKIVAFIPADVVSVYVAGLGIFQPQSQLSRWLVFFVCLALVPFFALLGGSNPPGPAGPVTAKARAFVTLAGAVAFVAWCAALPESPFLAVLPEANRIGAFAAVVLTGVLPVIGARLGVT